MINDLPDPVWLVALPRVRPRHEMVAHCIRFGYTLCGVSVGSREWRPADLIDQAVLCRSCASVPPGYATSGDLVVMGATYRQVDHWTRLGYLRPTRNTPGSGVLRIYPLDEMKIVATMAALTRAGIKPHAAHHAARNGGQLTPTIRVVVDEDVTTTNAA